MTVYHPGSLDSTPAGPPGGVTVGRTTYHVNSDGSIDCPVDKERDIAGVLAAAHDVEIHDILGDEPEAAEGHTNAAVPDEAPEVTPEYGELTYDELMGRARERDISGRSTMDKSELIDALHED